MHTINHLGVGRFPATEALTRLLIECDISLELVGSSALGVRVSSAPDAHLEAGPEAGLIGAAYSGPVAPGAPTKRSSAQVDHGTHGYEPRQKYSDVLHPPARVLLAPLSIAMVSLRGLQTTSTVSGSSASANSTAASSATESTSSTSTSTNSAATTAPSSSFSSVTTKKETTSSGEVITTVTATTTTVSTSSASTSSTTSNTANSSGVTSSGNAATEGNAGSVSTTTVTTTENGDGSPVTTVTTDNGVNTTTTSTTKDATTGITTVTTTTKTDSDMNGSASSSRTWTTTSGGSSTSANTAETSTTGAQESTSTAGTSTSTSTTTASSSTGATTEGASTSTTTSTGSSTGTLSTGENSVSSTTNGQTAASTTTSTGSSTGATSSTTTGGNSINTTGVTTVNGETSASTTNSDANSVTKTASSSAGTTSASTSTTTTTSSSTGETTSSGTNANSATTSTTTTASSSAGSTTGASTATTSTTTTTSSSTGSTNGATESSTAKTVSSTGSQSTATTKANSSSSKASSSATETTTVSEASSSDGSAVRSATSSTSGSSSKTSSSSSSSSSSSLASWFLSNFRNDETQLVVGSMSSITTTGASHQVCNGLPALVTRSDSETPNGGCPEELTALNASCTCITGYNETDSSWAFHVTTESWNTTTITTTRALTQTSSDELAINTIRPIWVSSSLRTLEIEGAGETLNEITFINENRVASGSSLTLVQSTSNSSNISTLSIYNIDLNSVAKKNSDFVPSTVTNLTLRNCNISTLGSSFTREWSWVQYLDLSSNSIDTEYVGGSALKELNMSHNALAVFPAATLNSSGLEALYIQGNDITDFNVSQYQFKQIQGLSAFTADQPSSASTCEGGAWESAHGTTFCVLGASTAAVPDSANSSGSDSDGHHGGLGLLGYWLIAGAIIVFFLLLLVIWQRRRQNNERDSSPIVSPEAIEPTTPKYNANDAFGDVLNRDAATAAPVAAGARTVGSGAYPAGYGRSHGNSVDSEDTALGISLASNPALAVCRINYDEVTLGRCISRGGFGLVFVGSYRGRQVAVKKIRNERDVEREQVEQFVREISLVSGLNHPRIVEFIGASWTTPAELSAVTELMERGDLRDVTRRFKRRGYRLSWEAHKTVIALHIAEALTYLHGLSPTLSSATSASHANAASTTAANT
ncbi:hypothetical protein ON010_g13669 [Phytophthora cinnamomi]|nr:hypothetical protein ON010_g13669 [Phytophthora cinnamomi]